MTLVDGDGRLFGRLNLLDALVLVIIAGLVPMLYGAYLLFRTPLPRLTSVEPAVVAHDPRLRVTVRGEHLRPFHRVSFNNHQGQTFEFRNPAEAEVEVVNLPLGVYDVVLYDHAQERSRLPGGLTVMPSPVPGRSVLVVGKLGNLTEDEARGVDAGFDLQGVGEVLRVGSALPGSVRLNTSFATIEVPVEESRQRPLVARVVCEVHTPDGRADCRIGGIPLFPDRVVPLQTQYGTRPFLVEQVMGVEEWRKLSALVRVQAEPRVLALIDSGDVDLAIVSNELAAGARVRAVSVAGATSRDVRLELDAQESASGWTIAGVPVRAGGPFTLRTPEYEVTGTILQLAPQDGDGR